jgi:RNA polymerase sigma-70 factor (ECF subfamily)
VPSFDPSSAAEERELLGRCISRRPEAWDEFIRRYHPLIEGAIRFTFLRCVYSAPEHDVANVVQDLYTRLYEDDFRRLRSFEGRCPIGAWLKSLAVRHALNSIRDEKLRGRFGGGSLDEIPLQIEDPREAGIIPEEREEIGRLGILLDQLGPLQRTAIRMYYFDGLPYRQIATALGVTTQTVGSLISRGRDRLRGLMKKPRGGQ